MKKFSLLSLLAIIALSASLSHAAAESGPFQEKMFLLDNNKARGFKQIAPDNFVLCKLTNKKGNLQDPKSWGRANKHFYTMTMEGQEAKFEIRPTGPSVAAIAERFGGQVQQPQVAAEAVDPVIDPATDQADGANEKTEIAAAAADSQAELSLQDANDGGKKEDVQQSTPNFLVRTFLGAKKAFHQATATADETPTRKTVMRKGAMYRITDTTQMRWNEKGQCYNVFELVIASDENGLEKNMWREVEEKRYEITSVNENGIPNFSEIKEKREDASGAEAEEKEYGDEAGALALASKDAPSKRASGEDEDAFANAYGAPRSARYHLSAFWNGAAEAFKQATATVQEEPQIASPHYNQNGEQDGGKQDAQDADDQDNDGQPARVRGWRNGFSSALAYVQKSVEQAIADAPEKEQSPDEL